MTAICNRKTLRTLLAALLILCMVVSLSVVSALADDATGTETETSIETDTASEAESGDETGTDATDAASDSASATETGSAAVSETESAAETKSAEQKKSQTRRIINLIVGGVILVGLVIAAVLLRDKIPGWIKSLKSECGKIVWCPKDKLKKNSFVVVVIIVALTVLIALLDIAFSTGIIELGKIIRNIGK